MNPWRVAGGRAIPLQMQFGIMGILNLTPDSFYDGGQIDAVQTALARCGKLLREGSDIIDIGAESTRPGAREVKSEAECARLLPALRRIRREFPAAVLSVDTRHARTADLALQAGCDIINDISACELDSAMLDVLIEHKPGYVLMHSQGSPETMQKDPVYEDVLGEVKHFFERKLASLTQAGLPEDRIVLDPGIGFGKTLAHNLELLRHIDQFLQFDRPLLCGISMKGMFARLLNLPLKARGAATATASALLFAKGVVWHRVHRPAEARLALTLAQAMQP